MTDPVAQSPSPPVAQSPVTSRRSLSRLALFLLLGAGTITLLLWWGGGAETLAVMGQANWALIAGAVIVHYGGFALRGHRWQRLLAVMGHRRSYGYVTGLLLSGWFLSALLPARAGDVARVGVLRLGRDEQAPVPVADALGSIVLERTLDIVAILGLGAAFGFVVLRTRLPGWIVVAYASGLGLLAVLGLVLLATPIVLHRIERWSARPFWQKGIGFLTQLVESLRVLLRQPGQATILAVESALIWLCDAVLLWLVVLALGEPISFASAAFVALTVDVFAAVPLTPGGIGQIELAYTTLLALLALPVAVVPAAVLLVRAISYWSFLGVSGVAAGVMGMGALWKTHHQTDNSVLRIS